MITSAEIRMVARWLISYRRELSKNSRRSLVHVESGTPAEVTAAWDSLAKQEGNPQ